MLPLIWVRLAKQLNSKTSTGLKDRRNLYDCTESGTLSQRCVCDCGACRTDDQPPAANHARGSDEQMFGEKQQIPPAQQSD
jgi:hypothetical protein